MTSPLSLKNVFCSSFLPFKCLTFAVQSDARVWICWEELSVCSPWVGDEFVRAGLMTSQLVWSRSRPSMHEWCGNLKPAVHIHWEVDFKNMWLNKWTCLDVLERVDHLYCSRPKGVVLYNLITFSLLIKSADYFLDLSMNNLSTNSDLKRIQCIYIQDK